MIMLLEEAPDFIQCVCEDCGPTVDGKQRCTIRLHPAKFAFNYGLCGECLRHCLEGGNGDAHEKGKRNKKNRIGKRKRENGKEKTEQEKVIE